MSILLCRSLSEVPCGFQTCLCAVSGGSLADFLSCAQTLTRNQLCIRLEMVCMDFQLPCRSGNGTPLAPDTVSSLRRKYPVFYSEALATEYLTYFAGSQLHMVLTDSEDTLHKKLILADQLGIPYALIQDPTLFSRMSARKNAPQKAGRQTHI